MDFSLSPELVELQQRTRSFIRDRIIPLEGERGDRARADEEFRHELVALGRGGPARAACVGGTGGPGLNNVGKAVVFEEAGIPAGFLSHAHLRARRSEHSPPWRWSRRRSRRSGGCVHWHVAISFLLLHDRTRTRSGFRSFGAGDDSGEGWQPLGDQW